MKNSPVLSIVVFSVLRLAAFLVPFTLMMMLPAFAGLWWLAALFAALIGLSISVLFLRRPLADATTAMANRRAARTAAAEKPRSEREIEDEIEDAANDEAQQG